MEGKYMVKATVDKMAEMSYIYINKAEIGDVIHTVENDGCNIDVTEYGIVVGIEISGILEVEDISDKGLMLDIEGVDLG